MVNALYLISVQRGYDPRDFVLVGFGGAGPVHANAIARDAEMPTLLIPRSPGIFSATGLLTTALVLTQVWFPQRYFDYALQFRLAGVVLARDLVLVALVAALALPARLATTW